MKIVAILHRSAGNESVGDMWRETKIFDDSESLKSVFVWAQESLGDARPEYLKYFKGHLEITIAQEKDSVTTLGSMGGL